MRYCRLGLVVGTLLGASVCAKSAYGPSVLVVLDPDQKEASFSKFLGSLRARGFDLTVRTTKEGPALFEFDESPYDHLILLAPNTKGITGDLSPQSLYEFVATPDDAAVKPHSMLVSLDGSASESWRDFAREFSLEFEGRGSSIVDYFGPSSSEDQSIAAVQATSSLNAYVSALSSETLNGPPVLYRGIAHTVPPDFPLAFSLLSASTTSFNAISAGSTADDESYPFSPLSLVTGFQTTNNARILWSGSLDLFSDAFATAESGNEAFVRDVSRWLLGEQGVLRVENVIHRRIGEEFPRDQYRVKDEWSYSAEISEWRENAWRPANLPELQLELTMLDPHLRIPLLPAALERTSDTSSATQSTLYAATAKLPTRHGVFTARLRHLRTPALSWLDDTVRFSVTPPRHDEWPRFIVGAWPYYAGAASTMAAWWIFSVLWLALDPREPVPKKKDL